MTGSFALQAAIAGALAAHAGVRSFAGAPPRIYDDVPEKPVFPYITIGDDETRDWSTGSDAGAEHGLTIHVWSRYAGRREAKLLMDEIAAALHDQPVALSARRLINLRLAGMETFRLGDGETWHGIVRLRAVTEPL